MSGIRTEITELQEGQRTFFPASLSGALSDRPQVQEKWSMSNQPHADGTVENAERQPIGVTEQRRFHHRGRRDALRKKEKWKVEEQVSSSLRTSVSSVVKLFLLKTGGVLMALVSRDELLVVYGVSSVFRKATS